MCALALVRINAKAIEIGVLTSTLPKTLKTRCAMLENYLRLCASIESFIRIHLNLENIRIDVCRLFSPCISIYPNLTCTLIASHRKCRSANHIVPFDTSSSIFDLFSRNLYAVSLFNHEFHGSPFRSFSKIDMTMRYHGILPNDIGLTCKLDVMK